MDSLRGTGFRLVCNAELCSGIMKQHEKCAGHTHDHQVGTERERARTCHAYLAHPFAVEYAPHVWLSQTVMYPCFVHISYNCRLPRPPQYVAKRRSYAQLPDTCGVILANIVLPPVLHTCFCAMQLVLPAYVRHDSGHRWGVRLFVDVGWTGKSRS